MLSNKENSYSSIALQGVNGTHQCYTWDTSFAMRNRIVLKKNVCVQQTLSSIAPDRLESSRLIQPQEMHLKDVKNHLDPSCGWTPIFTTSLRTFQVLGLSHSNGLVGCQMFLWPVSGPNMTSTESTADLLLVQHEFQMWLPLPRSPDQVSDYFGHIVGLEIKKEINSALITPIIEPPLWGSWVQQLKSLFCNHLPVYWHFSHC